MALKNLWKFAGIVVQVDEDIPEVYVTDVKNPSVTVQIRRAQTNEGLVVSTPFKMEMGMDEGEPAVLITKE